MVILRPSLFAPTRLLLLGTYLKKRSSSSPQLVAIAIKIAIAIATAGKDVGGEGDEIGWEREIRGRGEGAGGERGGGGGREGCGHDQNQPSFLPSLAPSDFFAFSSSSSGSGSVVVDKGTTNSNHLK